MNETYQILFLLARSNMAEDLERNSVVTRSQYHFIRKTHNALGNFHKDIWLLKHNLRLVRDLQGVKKEDVQSGSAAREITHLKRVNDCTNICAYKEYKSNQREQRGALVMQVYGCGDLWALLSRYIARQQPFPKPFI
jgi:hypothetical protein